MFRGILIAFGLINFAFGILGFIDPVVVTTWNGFGLEGPAAFGEVRAGFGGVFAAVGILYLAAIAVANPKPLLGALTLIFTGLTTGRIVSLTIDGWSPYTAAAGRHHLNGKPQRYRILQPFTGPALKNTSGVTTPSRLKTIPSFMTNCTSRSASMSSRGLPGTPIMSAASPTLIGPRVS